MFPRLRPAGTSVPATIEDNRENNAIITICAGWTRHEHRFAGVAAVLEPASHLIASEVETQQLIVEAFRALLSAACSIGGCVVQPSVTRVVDRGQLGELVE